MKGSATLGSIIGKTRKNSKGEVMTVIAFRNGKVNARFLMAASEIVLA